VKKRFTFLVIGFVLLATGVSLAKPIDVKEENLKARADCWDKHPDWVFDYFKREACIELRSYQIKKQTEEAIAQQKAAQKELDNRACLRDFISKTETAITSISGKLNTRMTFDEAVAAVRSTQGMENLAVFTDPEIKYRYLTFNYEAACETKMSFTVNVREPMNKDGSLGDFTVWVYNPAVWYPVNAHNIKENLSINYGYYRSVWEQIQRDIQLAEEKEGQSKYIELLQSSFQCQYGDACTLTFGIKNNSKYALKSAAISFDVVPRDSQEQCPANPAPRRTLTFSSDSRRGLNAGQTEWLSAIFTVPYALWQRGVNYCAKVVSVEFL
jgi:hypothetical protein